MNTIAIITVVVVALMTVAVALLTWLAYSSFLRAYGAEVRSGARDYAIIAERSRKMKGGLLGRICSWVALSVLLATFVTGIVVKATGDEVTVNGTTALVIKSGSMSDFYDAKSAEACHGDRSLQFDVGDVCFFVKVDPSEELSVGSVYGYRRKGAIITHRLMFVEGDTLGFKGDNNPAYDGKVLRDAVAYRYLGKRLFGIGSLALYAQSPLGIWSTACAIGIVAGSEVAMAKVSSIERKRLAELGVSEDEE